MPTLNLKPEGIDVGEERLDPEPISPADQHPRQRLFGQWGERRVEDNERQHRMKPEPALVGRSGLLLLRMRAH